MYQKDVAFAKNGSITLWLYTFSIYKFSLPGMLYRDILVENEKSSCVTIDQNYATETDTCFAP